MERNVADIDKLFGGMAKAEIFGSGNFMGPGVYTVKTKNILVKDGFKGQSFIAEFEILESNNEKHAPGSSGTWILKFKWPQTFGNITKFVMALLGYEPTAANQNNSELRELVACIARAACGSDGAKQELGANYQDGMLHGVTLKLECTATKTAPKPGQPQGGDFTVYSWSPLVDVAAVA
jgi:hypothetical protein